MFLEQRPLAKKGASLPEVAERKLRRRAFDLEAFTHLAHLFTGSSRAGRGLVSLCRLGPVVWPEPTSSSPRQDRIFRKRKTIFPKTFFHHRKEVFPLLLKIVNGSYSRRLENINWCFFFRLYVGRAISHGDSTSLGSGKKGRLCERVLHTRCRRPLLWYESFFHL